MLAAVFLLGVPLVASADNGSGSSNSGPGNGTYVTPGLLKLAKQHPGGKIKVIIQSTAGLAAAERAFGGIGSLHRRLDLVNGVAVEIPSTRLEKLANIHGLTITPDSPVKTSGGATYNSNQLWPYESGVAKLWDASGPTPPAIAIVDSGIQADRADFGGRVLANVNLSTLPNNSPGDGRGHGTFVAGVAAGSAAGYTGAAPKAPIVMLDVMDDAGMARTSDVIAACNWILANKARYNIRVANFSLHSSTPSNFTRDPLDKAVEKLWFSNVVVVAAAGNYGIAGGPSRVRYAPGNDPFVITVGAVDIGNTVGVGNDSTPAWSAYGYTYDGFWKPELGAPGRFVVGPVPATSSLAIERATSIVAPGYVQLSGTSFSTPAVAGAAAQILAQRPGLTPSQVKGALMASAKPAPNAAPYSVGVGELNAAKAAGLSNPPNPNAALERYVGADPAGGSTRVFNAVAWLDAAEHDVSWDSVSWGDVSWDSAMWNVVSWGDVSWGDVSWMDVSSSDVSWGDVSWTDVSWEDAAEADVNAEGGYDLTPSEAEALAADPDLAPSAAVLPPEIASALVPDSATPSEPAPAPAPALSLP